MLNQSASYLVEAFRLSQGGNNSIHKKNRPALSVGVGAWVGVKTVSMRYNS